MSRRPIALSPDLLRLRNEGYDLEVIGSYLLVRDVPYVNSARQVKRGILFCNLDLAGDLAQKPQSHVAYWTGEHPCHSDGRKITAIENPSGPQNFGEGLKADFTFSAKADYRDYHHKVTTYVGRITGEAAVLDPNVTAKTFPALADDDSGSVFKYADSASSRAGIGAVNEKLAGQRVGVIGLGGTGSYVLDLVAKTKVAEIHLFDGDVFLNHNAFRAPGAPTLDELQEKRKKVAYLSSIYSNIRHGIVPHDDYLTEENIGLLDGLSFVFLCLDRGDVKRTIVDRLVANGTPFVDVGMGVVMSEEMLGGIVRVTTSTADTRAIAAPHISFAEEDGVNNEYTTNIQVAELNALNAALAVIRWKKHFGFYQDTRSFYTCGFSIPSGEIIGEGLR